MRYQNCIFDLYGTLADIRTDETSPRLWVRMAEYYRRRRALYQQMLYLLKKTSDSAGVSTAVQKLKEPYSDVDDCRKKKMLAKFDELGISPISKPKG